MTAPQEVFVRFEEVNPRGAALLSMVDTSCLRLCCTGEGEENILDQRGEEPFYLHDSSSGAMKEAVSWWSAIEMKKTDCLVIFGIGAGWHFRALLPWLQRKEERRVIILEDDLAVISCFLQTENAKLFFSNPQSTLLYIEDGDEGQKVLELVGWNLYQKKYKVVASPSNKKNRFSLFQKVEREVITQENNVKSVLDEFFTFGEGQLRNFGRNIFFWQKSLQASSLFGKFHGCPAIVVAAGPSLDEDLDLLRKANSTAVILAGGSSIGALLQGGVTPHFTATVDPNATQYIRMRQAQPFCLPLFYRSRALFEGLFFNKGPFLYLRGGDGYPIVESFENSLGVTGKTLDGGESVSNLLIELAFSLGCSPIIMVGYDLSYTKDARYAKGVSESLKKDESIAFDGTVRGELVQAASSNGNSVTTEVKWVVEGRWIEKFQKEHPHVHLINTSLEGLSLSGIPVEALSEVIERYCPRTRDIDGMVHLSLQEAKKMPFSLDMLARTIYQHSKGIETVQKLLQKIIQLAPQYAVPEESSDIVELIFALEQEEAYKSILLPFAMMHQKLFSMRSFLETRSSQGEEQEAFFARAFLDRCRFLLRACEAHQRFFFSTVSWGCSMGSLLPEALSLAPLPAELVSVPEGVFQ